MLARLRNTDRVRPTVEAITTSVDNIMENFSQLSEMMRPGLLVRAARMSAATGGGRSFKGAVNGTRPTYQKLMEDEAQLDLARRNGDASYSPTRHVEVLSHLLTEAGYGALT